MHELTKKQVAQHLELALQAESDELRHRVDLLHRVLTKKPARASGQAKWPVEYNKTNAHTYEVTLFRKDAQRVEEIFADFLYRKNIEGEWKVSDLKPVKLVDHFYRFTFRRTDLPKPPKAFGPKKQKKAPVKSTKQMIAEMSAEDKAQLLKDLGL